MRVERFMNFDTHAAVKRLIAVGLQDRVAEEVVSSIALGRDYDFSKLVTKDEFLKFKGEVSEKFNKIENEIALIKQEIKTSRKETKAEIEALRKEAKADNEVLRNELKAEIEVLRKEVIGEIVINKNDILKWVVSLFIVQMTSSVGLFITILIKLYF